MSHNKERILILNEVRRGELEIPDAITRLQALSARPETPEHQSKQDNTNRELRILRTDLESVTVLMDIRLPINLLDAAERVGANFAPYLALIPTETMQDCITKPGTHKLVDVLHAEGSEHLEIFLE
ncbi:MAG: hypothetical protein GX884_01525 [Chloroflexi bacterium]|nr:hypothetical protein [Chloroflexota bacterium]